MKEKKFQLLIEHFLPWIVLVILVLYTYASFFQIPYAGFDFSFDTVIDVIIPDAPIQVGDRILQVGTLPWSDFLSDARQLAFENVQPDTELDFIIQRGDQTLSITWLFPGFSREEFISRLLTPWYMAYIFWLAGTVILLFMRPKDSLWWLLIAFNYLTAVWLIVGITSRWHIFGSLLVLKAAIWLCVPVYLHLHWVFPKTLRSLPRGILWVVYFLASLLALLEIFQQIPTESQMYVYAFFMGVFGSALLLTAHVVVQPNLRRTIIQFVAIGFLALLVTLIMNTLVVLLLANDSSTFIPGGGLLALPAIPFAYLYTAYRHQLAGRGFRMNRLIVVYLYLLIMFYVAVILAALVQVWSGLSGVAIFVGVLVVMIIGVLASVGYPTFRSFVERRFLGMPLAPSHLLETYTARITTSLDEESLVTLLKDEILPSLLVRQSALLGVEEDGRFSQLYRVGVEADRLPEDVTAVASQFRLDEEPRFIPKTAGEGQSCAWVRLALPLRMNQQLIGLWLLGDRDPDDFYSQAEIPTLQRLADQTAIALTNIVQAERLHALYQANIDRQEAEQSHLARVLHDEVLNQLAVMRMYADPAGETSQFSQAYQSLVGQLRQTISGLRPTMLNYGLTPALEELADEMSERTDNGLQVEFELPSSEVRYEAKVEQHLYRIVQQACENSLRHAQARTSRISGQLDPDRISLVVEDDGIGFSAGDGLELSELLAHKHFGLVGMHERAAIIGARLHIDSMPGRGTRVFVNWQPG